MDMKVKSSLIRKYRAEHLWSQDQLAQVSGLSLRTIQRLEARGSASQETIKAMAAVFEVPHQSLLWPDGGYQTYTHKQWGWVTLIILPVTASAVLLIPVSTHPELIGLVVGVLTIATVIFSSMTVAVNESEVSWFFGPGVLRKHILLEEIAKCDSVTNPLWMGFGIHTFGTGWIYNVSGMLGVKIELKSGAFVRLGTSQPNYLIQAIEDAMDNSGV